MDKDLSPAQLDKISIDLLLEAFQIEDYTIQTKAITLMQKMVWNRYFVGSGVCKEFSQFEKKLSLINHFRVVPDIDERPTGREMLYIETSNPFLTETSTKQKEQHSLVDLFCTMSRDGLSETVSRC
jgi:hypothetical protein